MLNLSQLFYSSDPTHETLLTKLDLDPKQRAFIENAKGQIRVALKEGIPTIYKDFGLPGIPPAPRFFTQGSWAYKTLNGPCQPPQEADIDDGCYLPMTFVTLANKPSVAADVFFRVAEAALAPLVKAHNWKFSSKPKPTCIRIHISSFAHVDIPLYAIPDDEFAKLKKSLTMDAANQFEAFREAASIDRWEALPLDKVLLAHRDENWKSSDPRPLHDWFLDQVEVQGPQLRRVVRYLKAFRDCEWAEGGPASILLMAATAPLFQEEKSRDDQALLNVVKGLPAALRAGVKHPTDASESLTDRLRNSNKGTDLVDEAAERFEYFGAILEATLAAGNAEQGVTWMRQQFGDRFPNSPDRVKVSPSASAVGTAGVSGVAATIASTPAKAGPSPLVGPTHAG